MNSNTIDNNYSIDRTDQNEIIRILFEDYNIEYTNDNVNAILQYYDQYDQMPQSEHIIRMLINNQINQMHLIPISQSTENIEKISDDEYSNKSSESESEDNYDEKDYEDEDDDTEEVDEEDDDTEDDEEEDDEDDNTQTVQNTVPSLQFQFLIRSGAQNSNNQNIDQRIGSFLRFFDLTNNVLIQDNQLNFLNNNNVRKVIKEVEEVEINMFDKIKNPQNEECFICYDSFKSEEIVRILPCKHIFHRCCIDKYLKTQSILCPYCKTEAGESKFDNI